jgi:hypothetical protein
MMTQQQNEIVRVLQTLPTEQVRQVLDFTLFLAQRYANARPVDESTSWSEEDMRDFARASMRYAEESDPKLAEFPDE